MRQLILEIPDEAWELLEQGAGEAKSPIEEFAFFCLCSVLANYAVEVEADTGVSVSPGDVSDSDHALDDLAYWHIGVSDLTP